MSIGLSLALLTAFVASTRVSKCCLPLPSFTDLLSPTFQFVQRNELDGFCNLCQQPHSERELESPQACRGMLSGDQFESPKDASQANGQQQGQDIVPPPPEARIRKTMMDGGKPAPI